MTKTLNKNLEAQVSNKEIITDVLIPGQLSKRLTKGINPKTEVPLYAGMILTGLLTQAIIYTGTISGIYTALEQFF